MDSNAQDAHQTNGPPVCSRCNKHIYDGTVFQLKGNFWHSGCVKCVICRTNITGCCHMKGNELYCRTDFIRLFGAKCSSCRKTVSPSDLVHVAYSNLYHIACFSCIECGCKLQAGHYFYVKDDGKLLCSPDYQRLLTEDSVETDSGSDESGSDDTDPVNHTCFNDNQLRMLTETYETSKRPSRNLRKKMSMETGLSVRTIQIWFQNRRAKDRNQCKNNNNSYLNNKGNQILEQNQPFNQLTPQFDNPTSFENYQLYCPLDFLVPNEMPPNVDLSSADICNGEVVARKRNSDSFHVPQQTTHFLPDGSYHWLTV